MPQSRSLLSLSKQRWTPNTQKMHITQFSLFSLLVVTWFLLFAFAYPVVPPNSRAVLLVSAVSFSYDEYKPTLRALSVGNG